MFRLQPAVMRLGSREVVVLSHIEGMANGGSLASLEYQRDKYRIHLTGRMPPMTLFGFARLAWQRPLMPFCVEIITHTEHEISSKSVAV